GSASGDDGGEHRSPEHRPVHSGDQPEKKRKESEARNNQNPHLLRAPEVAVGHSEPGRDATMRSLQLNAYFDARRALIDDYLHELSTRTAAPLPLDAPLRRSLTSSGKRVRGILVLAAGESVGAKPEKLALAAAAMEMIHV